MAATVSSPWGKPGAWALDAEEHEAELQQQEQTSRVDSSTGKLADFPSLATAAASKPKKKKGQTISLAEFNTYSAPKPTEPTRLTHEDMLMLPTGPRERSPEELERNRLGGGFKSYGTNRYNSNNSNGDDSNGRWGSSRAPKQELGPSRADEIDNWAAAKKSAPSGNGFGGGFERRERGGGGFFDGQSKADEVDNWAANKSNKSFNEAPPRRFGGGFEKRSSFDSLQSRDSQRDMDNWGRKKEESVTPAASGGVRPRLVLQPRTLPVTTEDVKKEAALAKPKGANPFGEARPREEVLKEKGKDWKEIDEKLEAVKIKETVAVAEKGERGERGGKGGFGNGRAPVDRSWRKNESVEAAPDADADANEPQSSENTENGHVAEN
ncbi:Plant specific eukaryotic initiation factor 4B [Corchorus capsularis]|uniref:Plant specific eukaryotic initiation factor 4B n=1 Tax=Corchorus capsularis TaxID=210143 RepID=A0A1R3HVT0_COCAP|nr:Plant specific eukaryotic initiation factor 4B [Corchorus capsularis]